MNDHSERNRLSPWRLFGAVLRAIGSLLQLWPLLLIALWFFSPITLHLRWQYTYTPIGQTRIYTACEYIGPRGSVHIIDGYHCPLFTLLDAREAR